MLFLTEDDVKKLLPMGEAIRMMRLAFQKLAAGEAQNQARHRLRLPNGSVLHSLAGAYGDYFGAKIYSTHPHSGAHFLFLLYAAQDARPLAMFEAGNLGQIRTGATTGLATDLLAPPEAETLGMIGSGFQARTQLEAILQVRRLRHVRVWSRKPENREGFAEECSEILDVPVEAVDSAEHAVRDADIVVTATNSKGPVLENRWVGAGILINAIGSNQPRRRELPAELVQRAQLIVVDSMEQTRLESGDLLLSLDPDEWASSRLVELKDIVSSTIPPAATGGVVIFKSNGLGLEDVAAASYVYENAQKVGVGKKLRGLYS